MTDTGWNQVGEITVDSGTIVVVDPCYVLRVEQDDSIPGLAYEKAVGIDPYPGPPAAVSPIPGVAGLLVSSGRGDGVYPVWAQYDREGRVASLRIDFIGEPQS